MTTPFGKVFFLAACRARDKAILASVAHNGKQIDPTAVKKMLKELDSMKSEQLYSFSMSEYAWSLWEKNGVIYIMAMAVDYPTRISAQCLRDAERLFSARVQDSWKTSREGGLQEASRKLLKNLAEKYDNLDEMDKMAATMTKVDAVKLQMQDNIQQALENCVTLEKIENDSADLQASAGIFKKQAQNLKNKMWWKNCKQKLLITFIVLLFIGLLALLIASQTGAFDDKKKKDNDAD